jgi:hypothetical protein
MKTDCGTLAPSIDWLVVRPKRAWQKGGRSKYLLSALSLIIIAFEISGDDQFHQTLM